MKPRLYLETTIPSYLVSRRSRDLRITADQETTTEWWDTKRHEYDLFTSEIVIAEVSEGDGSMSKARMEILASVPRLSALPQADEIIELLLRDGIIPPNATADAAHIALSIVHAMDFLLTWNCKHISNPHNFRRIERICARRGYACPVICTPEQLLPL